MNICESSLSMVDAMLADMASEVTRMCGCINPCVQRGFSRENDRKTWSIHSFDWDADLGSIVVTATGITPREAVDDFVTRWNTRLPNEAKRLKKRLRCLRRRGVA